jgi:hypothetical protein
MMPTDFRRTHEALFSRASDADELERQGILSGAGSHPAVDVVKLTQAVMTEQALIARPYHVAVEAKVLKERCAYVGYLQPNQIGLSAPFNQSSSNKSREVSQRAAP